MATPQETLRAEKDSKRSIQNFYDSFNRDHQEEVNKTAAYLREKGWKVNEVVVQIREIVKGETTQAIVHIKEHEGKTGYTMQQVNWDGPYCSGDYQEYGRSFHHFIGPAGAQEIRATLLAEAFNVPVSIQIFKDTPGDIDIDGNFVPWDQRPVQINRTQ
jgi:hypothetical protein